MIQGKHLRKVDAFQGLQFIAAAFAVVAIAACSAGGSSGFAPANDGRSTVSVSPSTSSIASIAIRVPVKLLPLGQSTQFRVIAKDRAGHVISGTYAQPIQLEAGGLSLSAYSVKNSTQASNLYATWATGVAGGAAATLQASANGHVATTYVMPGTGFAYFEVGTNVVTDDSGFQIELGPDGALYYGTIGSCSGSNCVPYGAVGRFDISTQTATELPLSSEVLGLLFTTDGALWFTGGSGHELYRLPANTFASDAIKTIPVPAPAAGAAFTPRMLAQDHSGNVWFGDGAGGRLLQISARGPYATASIHAYKQRRGPPGTPASTPFVNGLTFAGGTIYALDQNNGVIDRIDARSGRSAAPVLLPQQRLLGASASVQPRFITADATGALVLSYLGAPRAGALSQGGLDRFATGSSISSISLAHSPAGALPDTISMNGTQLYYTDVGMHAVGEIAAAGASRLIPTIAFSSVDVHRSPNGITALPDATAWFTCAGGAPFEPLCLGHTVYLWGWSLFPGPSFTLGRGAHGAQVVGIMESPSQNSGPFAAHAIPSRTCRASRVADHDFVLTGISKGLCTVTVTDAKGTSASISASVVP